MGDEESDRAARRLRLEAQRHAVLIASAVAHDVNNPIAFLSLASAELRRMVERGRDVPLNMERLSDLVREIEDSATRLGRIVQELRIFTRGADSARGLGGVVDLGRLIDGALTLAAGQLGGRARVEAPAVDSSSQAPVSFGYALLNVLLYIGDLLSRAAEAGEAAGEAGNAGETATPVLAIDSRETAGANGATLAVTVDIRSPLLARFAVAEEGTPLALELARDVLQEAGGDLVTRISSGGHCYELTIPTMAYVASEKKLAVAAPALSTVDAVAAPGAVNAARPRHRVLVVDDEVALSRALARGLSMAYDVDVACTAAEALTYLASTRYDAVVCDLHLSERSGTTIHEQVARVSADQARRFIFTTGASTAGDPTVARAFASGCAVLEKPFDGRSLEAEVARVARS